VLAKKPSTVVTDSEAESSRSQSAATTRPVEASRAIQAVAKEAQISRPTAIPSEFGEPSIAPEVVQQSTYFAPMPPPGGSERLLDFETTKSALGPQFGPPQSGAAPVESSTP
jgi:hypothetical protein